jgi:hypothetical protein
MFGGNLLWNIAKVATSEIFDGKQNDIAIVYSVILDETHPEIQNGKRNISDVGSIQCRLLSDIQNNELIFARPLDSSVTILPVRNQTVFVQKLGSEYVYTQISKGLSPNTSNAPNTISKLFPGNQKAESGAKSKKYSEVQSTGISRSSVNEVQNFDGFGDYFQQESGIHKLKLYEGDTLFQSRFGQSLRFSGYNNSENSFSPTLILRNGESALNRQSADDTIVEEDINRDGSVIVLGSNDYQLPFQSGVVDDNGSNNFETTPQSFKNYPNDLKGNQILLNSDRLIFSSKTSEMIFYSKGNYGFISDGELSIDNKFGITANVNDDINITTNNRDVNINSGNGNINLGNQNLESLVRGETLVQLLTELITAIEVMTVATPAGPSSPPINVASFSKVKGQLRTMLSNLNKTS